MNNSNLIECPDCDGAGYTTEGGMSMTPDIDAAFRVTCKRCDGTGYIEPSEADHERQQQ